MLKTASFAAVHFAVAFAVGYLLTGSFALASAVALIEPMANTVAYSFPREGLGAVGCRTARTGRRRARAAFGYGRLTTRSISTSAPTASAVTPTQVRAGSLPGAK